VLERPNGPILLAVASMTHGSAEPVVAGAVKSVGGHAAVSNNGHVAQAADRLAAALARPSGDEPAGNQKPGTARRTSRRAELIRDHVCCPVAARGRLSDENSRGKVQIVSRRRAIVMLYGR